MRLNIFYDAGNTNWWAHYSRLSDKFAHLLNAAFVFNSSRKQRMVYMLALQYQQYNFMSRKKTAWRGSLV